MLRALLLVLLTAAPVAHIGHWRAVVETCVGETTVCQTLTSVEEFVSSEQCVAAAAESANRLAETARRRHLDVTIRTHCIDESPEPYVA